MAMAAHGPPRGRGGARGPKAGGTAAVRCDHAAGQCPAVDGQGCDHHRQCHPRRNACQFVRGNGLPHGQAQNDNHHHACQQGERFGPLAICSRRSRRGGGGLGPENAEHDHHHRRDRPGRPHGLEVHLDGILHDREGQRRRRAPEDALAKPERHDRPERDNGYPDGEGLQAGRESTQVEGQGGLLWIGRGDRGVDGAGAERFHGMSLAAK